MSVARSVAEVLRDHVLLEVEAIERMYLNVYVPHFQSVGAVVGYLRVHRGQRFASTMAVMPMTEAFIRNIDQFAYDEGVDLVTFQIGQRKSKFGQFMRSRCLRPSTVGGGFRRLGRKHSAAGDLHRESDIAKQYKPCDHGRHREQQDKERSEIQEPERLQHR